MKKMMLIGMVVVMMFGLVGCNKKEKDIVEKIQSEEAEGFVPNEVVEEETADLIEEVIDTANLEKYYDVTKYVGTPRLEEDVLIAHFEDEGVTYLVGAGAGVMIPYDERLEDGCYYDCIIVDNGTETEGDDVCVYIFTE